MEVRPPLQKVRACAFLYIQRLQKQRMCCEAIEGEEEQPESSDTEMCAQEGTSTGVSIEREEKQMCENEARR